MTASRGACVYSCDLIFTSKYFRSPTTPLAHSFCIADGLPNKQHLWQVGFFVGGDRRVIAIRYSQPQNVHGSVFPRKCACCHSRCWQQTVLFSRHGPCWIISDLSSRGNVPRWKRARSVGLLSVRYRPNYWTTGQGAGTGGATSTASTMLFLGLP